MGGWRKLYNDEMGRACNMNGGRGMHIGYWWESQKINRPLGRHRWVANIKMDLRKILWDGMDWIDLAHDRAQ
jgi:hypothetical protein